MMTSLRSKWAAGKARGGRISKSIRNRRGTQPPAHFQRNPLGRGPVGCFSALLARPVSIQIWALRSRLEKQPTDLRRRHHYMRDGTLGSEERSLTRNSSTQLTVLPVARRFCHRPCFAASKRRLFFIDSRSESVLPPACRRG